MSLSLLNFVLRFCCRAQFTELIHVKMRNKTIGKMSGKLDNKCRVDRLRCVATVVYSYHLQIWGYTACGLRRLASLYRLIFLFFYNSSKIEKDDKSPGEESDISDDDTGLLFIFCRFVFSLVRLECVLNRSIRVRKLFNGFGYSKSNWRTSGPLQPITTRLKNSISQSRFGAKPQSIF